MSESAHETVLLDEAVTALLTDETGKYIDGTFGRGGHTRLLLQRLGDTAEVLGIDRDPQAVEAARELEQDSRFNLRQGEFGRLQQIATEKGWSGNVAGVLLDIGVSSPQLDQAERGFSFLQDGPLDMRMDPDHGESAADWIARAEEADIAKVLWEYGEERFSRRMAKAIVEVRQEVAITTTGQLAKIIAEANPAWEKGKHPATRAFQAIRIYINDELEELRQALNGALEILAPGGRIAVISFHSLEDRIVKRFFREQSKGKPLPRSVPVTDDMITRRLKLIGKAIKATKEETENNPRARSAVLRVAEKLA